ncbi:MAG: adenylate/guanylate cyclase domain-containing protein [Spirochaetales bacterium]|nr:adenylate/guanylate cyclase domain-containing protein [Spirochaetales bacterium]
MAKGSGFFSSKLARGGIVGLAAAAIGLAFLFTGVLDGLENTTWDLRVRLLAQRSSATDDVVLILVDQQSLDLAIEEYAISWPWPRSVYSYIIDFCREANVASLTFDLILQDQGAAGPGDDNALLYAAEALDRFVYGTQLDLSSDNPNDWPDYAPGSSIQISGGDALPEDAWDDMQFNRGAFPHPDVTAPNGGIGFVNGDNDADGVYRHYRLVMFHRGRPVPSLAVAAYAARADDSVVVEYGTNSITIDGTEFPIDSDGYVLLKYTTVGDSDHADNPEAVQPRHTSYTAWDILQSALALQGGVEPVIDPADLEGKYVLLGLEAAGLFDLRPTSVDSRAPGVTVHATMLDNLLSGEVMRDFSVWATAVLLVILTVGAAMAATYASKTISEVLLMLGFLAGPVLLAGGAYMIGAWLQLVVLLIAVFLALAAANVANYATEGAAKRQIRGMFGRYLSPAVISQLEENPEAAGLGGKEAEITIFFSDIQKFSVIATKLDADVLVSFLNLYLTPMTNVILDEGGGIDKYEGDAIIAQWGAPIEHEDHAQRGLRSMVKCQTLLEELRPQLREQFGVEVYQRIGMSSGPAIVGNMGSDLRFDYTMIGKAVNLAARLEGANKAFGAFSMVSEYTIDKAGGVDGLGQIGVAVRELGYIAVVGMENEPLRVYEPMQPDEHEKRSSALAAYDQGLKLFQAGQFSDAKAIFERLAEVDPAAASYVPRCDTLIAKPPADWNGVWVLTEKG